MHIAKVTKLAYIILTIRSYKMLSWRFQIRSLKFVFLWSSVFVHCISTNLIISILEAINNRRHCSHCNCGLIYKLQTSLSFSKELNYFFVSRMSTASKFLNYGHIFLVQTQFRFAPGKYFTVKLAFYNIIHDHTQRHSQRLVTRIVT